jgi:hypothetical protein
MARIVPTGPDDTARLCNSHRDDQEAKLIGFARTRK